MGIPRMIAHRVAKSPMSWKSGNQMPPPSPEPSSMPSLMASIPASALPWVSRTPLGAAVLPEVNCTIARSVGATVGSIPAEVAPQRRSSAQTNAVSPMASLKRPARARKRDETTTRRIPATDAIRASRFACPRRSRAALGSGNGHAAAPVRVMANRACRNSGAF